MKKIILLLTLLFTVSTGFSQYVQISLSKTENDTYLERIINDHFYEIGRKWKVDSYVLHSANIISYYETLTLDKDKEVRKKDGYLIKVKGKYKYKRLTTTYTGSYEAIIGCNTNKTPNFTIRTLTYEE